MRALQCGPACTLRGYVAVIRHYPLRMLTPVTNTHASQMIYYYFFNKCVVRGVLYGDKVCMRVQSVCVGRGL